MLVILIVFLIPNTYAAAARSLPPCNPQQIREIADIGLFISNQKIIGQTGDGQLSFCIEYGSPGNANKLQSHLVCRDGFNSERKIYVDAEVRSLDLRRGTRETINLTVKKDLTRFYKACGCDEAGHAIGNEVGGPPTEENLFPQNRNLNTGHWKTVSNKLSTHLDVPTDDRHAAVEMAFSFTDRFHQNRPDSFAYRFTLFTTRDGYMANNGPSRNVEKVIYGKFLNEDHTHTDLMGCADGNQELYWAEIADQRFYGRQSCDIDRFYYPIYGRPQPAG